MSLSNSRQRYGLVARSLHWLTALLILAAIPLGLYANSLPYDTSEALAAKARVFSLHKTIGVAAFLVALARIAWALAQPRPAPLHPDRRAESWLAEVVHWSLYLSLVVVPLSGWVHHAATTGFAPILWPFGDDLPFVPESPALAEAAGAVHWLFTKVLAASILLHVAGALKHALVDRDATLARMLTGREAGADGPRHGRGAPVIAAATFAALTAAALSLPQGADAIGRAPEASSAATETATAAGNWQVVEGALSFSVRQMGAEVTGTLPAWTADITFDPDRDTGNRVRVSIDTTGLTLGSVTDQAKGVDFFDVATHPTALFEADILRAGDGYEAKGTLTLRGVTVPVDLPFTLTLEGDMARMTGQATLDRRDFGMGTSYGDEETVGFSVVVSVDLTASRR